jgi:hypothetical protein
VLAWFDQRIEQLESADDEGKPTARKGSDAGRLSR